MPIDIYLLKYSPPCRAVLLVLKALKIDYNVKVVDLSTGQHLQEDFIKLNPGHTIPTISDDGFVLWESRAIMKYLTNQYGPDSGLYPNNPKQRAVVDRWLDFDYGLFASMREAIGSRMFGLPVTDQAIKALDDKMKLLDQLIGDNKYLVADHLTLADLAVLITTHGLFMFGHDISGYPNFQRWATTLAKELPYFDEVNDFSKEEVMAFATKVIEFRKQQKQMNF